MRLAGILVCLCTAGVAIAASPASDRIGKGYAGKFVRAGGSFACNITPPAGAPAPTDDDFVCLYMGALAIDGSADALKSLGTPVDQLPAKNGATTFIYVFSSLAPPLPYLAVTVHSGSIVAIQATGKTPLPGSRFQDVNLGMTAEAVKGRFGEPMQISSIQDIPGAELWGYEPWGFSFEVLGGRITSIRLRREDF